MDAKFNKKFRRDLISKADGNRFYYACSDHNNTFKNRIKIDHTTLREKACQLVDDLRHSPDDSKLSLVLTNYLEQYPAMDEGDFEDHLKT